MRYRLTAFETHPIQYKAPLFRHLAADPRFELTVLYAMLPSAEQQGAGFGVPFAWDVPLLEGYRYEVLDNRAAHPSVTSFGGCDTPRVRTALGRLRPDAVLVNGWVVKSCLQVLGACRRLGIPCLVRGEANRLRPRAVWKHALHRLLLSQYQGYLAIGSANRDFYRFHRCPERRIFWAPYCVDNAAFSAQSEVRRCQRDALRQEFGVPQDARVFLFVGKLEEKKHPLDLLHAVRLLPAAERHRIHAVVVGEGPLKEVCADFSAEHRLPVSYTGFLNQSRLPDVYSLADVLVLPSDAGETWGLVVNEAMASGRPAVVSRAAGCCRDLVVDGQTGFSFAVGDREGLATVLTRYIHDSDLCARQGEAAARHIRSFSFRQVADGLYDAVSIGTGGRHSAKRPSACCS